MSCWPPSSSLYDSSLRPLPTFSPPSSFVIEPDLYPYLSELHLDSFDNVHDELLQPPTTHDNRAQSNNSWMDGHGSVQSSTSGLLSPVGPPSQSMPPPPLAASPALPAPILPPLAPTAIRLTPLHPLMAPPAVPITGSHLQLLWSRLVRLLRVELASSGPRRGEVQAAMRAQYPGDKASLTKKVLLLDVPCCKQRKHQHQAREAVSDSSGSQQLNSTAQQQWSTAAERLGNGCVCYLCSQSESGDDLASGSADGARSNNDEFFSAFRCAATAETKLLLLSFNDDNIQLAQHYVALYERECRPQFDGRDPAAFDVLPLRHWSEHDTLVLHGDVIDAAQYDELSTNSQRWRRQQHAQVHQHILATSRYPDHRVASREHPAIKIAKREQWVQEWVDRGFVVVDIDAPDPWSFVGERFLAMIDTRPLLSSLHHHPAQLGWDQRALCCKAAGCSCFKLIGHNHNSKDMKPIWLTRHIESERTDTHHQLVRFWADMKHSKRNKRERTSAQRSTASKADKLVRREVTAEVESSHPVTASAVVQQLAAAPEVRAEVIAEGRAEDAAQHTQPVAYFGPPFAAPVEVPHVTVHILFHHQLLATQLPAVTVIRATVMELLLLLFGQLKGVLPGPAELYYLQHQGRIAWNWLVLETGMLEQARITSEGRLDIGLAAAGPALVAANFRLQVEIDVSGLRSNKRRRHGSHEGGNSDGKEERDEDEDDRDRSPPARYRRHSHSPAGSSGTSSSSLSPNSHYSLSPSSTHSSLLRHLRVWLLRTLATERNAQWVNQLDADRVSELRQQLLAACLLDEEAALAHVAEVSPKQERARTLSCPDLSQAVRPSIESAPLLLVYSREHYVRQRILHLLRPPTGELPEWVRAMDSSRVEQLVEQVESAEVEELQQVWLHSHTPGEHSAIEADEVCAQQAIKEEADINNGTQIEEAADETVRDEDSYVMVPSNTRSFNTAVPSGPFDKAQWRMSRIGSQLPIARRFAHGKLAIAATFGRLHSDLVRAAEQLSHPLLHLSAPIIARSAPSEQKQRNRESVTRQ